MNYSLGYITAASKTEAKEIVLTLLEEGLIACGNILPASESYYIWEGEIEKATEYVIIVKTKSKRHSKIVHAVQEMSSYQCPCIVFVPIEDASSSFLNWLDENC